MFSETYVAKVQKKLNRTSNKVNAPEVLHPAVVS